MSASNELAEFVAKLSEEVPHALIEAIHQVADSRNLVTSGEYGDDHETIHSMLVKNRRQIERMEEIVGNLVLLRARTQQAVNARKAAYDDAYMEAANKPSIGFGDYQSAKEKDAHFNASCVEESMSLRKAERTHSDVSSAHEYCRIMLRGAEGNQRDLELRMRLMSVANVLERG